MLKWLELKLFEDRGHTDCSSAGDVSWGKTHFKPLSERLQYLFGNISQLAGEGTLGLCGEEA